jgi:hypothetical protein
MESSAPGPENDRKTQEIRKEWRRPELRKLPIAATAGAMGKSGAINSSDGVGQPKSADASGQFS